MIVSWLNAVIWRAEFNDYIEELWGIADALNMSRLELFALNCADDIDLYTRTPNGSWFASFNTPAPTPASLKQVPPPPRGAQSRADAGLIPPMQCSDAVLPSALLWGHNEDAGMDIDMPDASTAYIVNLTNSQTGVRYTACAPTSPPITVPASSARHKSHADTRIQGSSAETRGAGTAWALSVPQTLCSPNTSPSTEPSPATSSTGACSTLRT